jgi:AraC-like DNA-binding protein
LERLKKKFIFNDQTNIKIVFPISTIIVFVLFFTDQQDAFFKKLYLCVMECIHEYIDVSSVITFTIDKSFCKTAQDEVNLYMTFGLFADDSLSDLSEKSYLIQIRITKNYLEKYNETIDLYDGEQPVCCKMESKLLDIIRCRLTGLHRKLFLESAVLFLFYQAQQNNLIFKLGCESCTILHKPAEIDKIQKAKKYILENLANNLTIPIIANNVGTNQCYLKKGFKEIFGQTIFEFVQENRMLKAKRLLQKENPKITEISYQVGYASLSSFSQSYKNFFGISPTEEIKQVFPYN